MSTRIITPPRFYCLVLAIAIVSLSGCGMFSHFYMKKSASSDAAPRPQIDAIELYLSHSHSHGAEFEHFKWIDDALFVECGEIRGGRNVPKTQQHLSLNQSAATLKKLASDLIEEKSERGVKLDAPGKGGSFFDPGRALLVIDSANGDGTNTKRSRFETSMAVVTNPQSHAEEIIKRLAVTIRTLANPPLCGNPSFYGLDR